MFELLFPPLLPERCKIIRGIARYYAEHGVPPTDEELGKAVGITRMGKLQTHLEILILHGYVSREGDGPRNLRLTDRARKEVLENAP